jgi:hypothetical protein
MKIALALAVAFIAVAAADGSYYYRPLVYHKGGAIAPLETYAVRAAKGYHAAAWNNAAALSTYGPVKSYFPIRAYSDDETEKVEEEEEKSTEVDTVEEKESEEQEEEEEKSHLYRTGLYGGVRGFYGGWPAAGRHHYGYGHHRYGGLGLYGGGHRYGHWAGAGSLYGHGLRHFGRPALGYSDTETEQEDVTAAEEDAEAKQVYAGGLYGHHFGGLLPHHYAGIGRHYGGWPHHQHFGRYHHWAGRWAAHPRSEEDEEASEEEKQLLRLRVRYPLIGHHHYSYNPYWAGRWGASYYAGRPYWW